MGFTSHYFVYLVFIACYNVLYPANSSEKYLGERDLIINRQWKVPLLAPGKVTLPGHVTSVKEWELKIWWFLGFTTFDLKITTLFLSRGMFSNLPGTDVENQVSWQETMVPNNRLRTIKLKSANCLINGVRSVWTKYKLYFLLRLWTLAWPSVRWGACSHLNSQRRWTLPWLNGSVMLRSFLPLV